jgi:predicted Zn-dependent peptidase
MMTTGVACVAAAGGIVGLLAVSAGAIRAQAPAPPSRPAVGAPRAFTPAARTERTLANGLRVIVARYPTVPKVSVSLTVRTGLAADPPALPGLAAMTADALQEGTPTRTSRRVREDAFAMGAALSASAGQDFTSVSIRGLAEFLPGLLDLLGDVVMNPSFPEQELQILRTNLLETLQRQRASPQFVSNREFRRALFGDHPYARVTATEDSVRAIDRAAVVRFHSMHFRPNHAFLLVVGDVAPETALGAVEKTFGAWARGDVAPVAFPDPPPLEGRRVVFVQRPSSVQTSLSIGNFAVRRSDPSWYSLLVANTIYGGAFNSRIVRNIREEKGYAYSPGSQFAAFGAAGFYRFFGNVRNEVTGPAMKEVFAEIDRMRAEGADGSELEGAKQYLRGVFVIQNGTQAGLANVLNTVYGFDLPRDYLETYHAKVGAITPADVRSAAERLLGSSDSVIVIVGDYAEIKDQVAPYQPMIVLDVDGRPIDPAGIGAGGR